MTQKEKPFISWGAKATVYLKCDKDIYDLTKTLSKGLNLPAFSIETDQDPPHEYFGICDTLGFRVWIHHEISVDNFNYVIEIKTSNAFEEMFYDRIYDISIWFANYISLVCSLESYVYDAELKQGLTFLNGNTI